jgi:hypothetical protein
LPKDLAREAVVSNMDPEPHRPSTPNSPASPRIGTERRDGRAVPVGSTGRRWDSDTRFVGIADAHPIAGDVRRLAAACTQPGWITEEADTYVGFPLRDACDLPGSPWHWIAASQRSDGTYVVDLDHTDATSGEIWEDALQLLSAVAEDSFHVRRVDDHTVECITGMLPGDGSFAPHGHTVRLRIG